MLLEAELGRAWIWCETSTQQVRAGVDLGGQAGLGVASAGEGSIGPTASRPARRGRRLPADAPHRRSVAEDDLAELGALAQALEGGRVVGEVEHVVDVDLEALSTRPVTSANSG